VKIDTILWAVLALAPVVSLLAAQPPDIEKRIDALLARMTLEEKLGQMSQDTFGQLNEARKGEIRKGRWGSLYGGGTPAERAEAQRIALKESRLGIPLVFGQDVIHGDRTVMPIPLGQAATWDPELVRQGARVAAREASGEGIQWTFSPMIDIARDPRWGRIAEGYGEDPYLTGVMGAAAVRGYQGDSLAAADSIAACAKHFVGYGAAEAGRDYNTTWIPEGLLRDVYLKPFLAAREAGVASFMSAFNALNGVPATGNRFTLTQVLRNEWKFDGVVVSDYTAVRELVAHGYAADDKDAALKAIRAGVDMEMVSRTYWDYGKALVASGQLDIKQIDEAVRRILRMKFRLGLFDGRPQPVPPAVLAPDPAALSTAKQLAAESLVLLKNDGALPLAKRVGKVAVIGFLADDPDDQAGTWAGDSRAGFQTPLASLRDSLGADRVLYAQGLKSSRDTSRAGFAAATEAARNADVALLFLGEEAALSGEAASRSNLDLPGLQEQLFEAVVSAGKPVVTVIMAGRPLTFAKVAEKSRAVLYAWAPGAMGGPAIADALLGNVSPSGKLPLTFPRSVGQVPIYYDHLSTGRPPAETGPGAVDRYRSKYLDVSFTPAYPFGYGLSYAKFEYSNARLSAPVLRMGGKITISADIANAGNCEADEIVQLYTHQLAGSVARPVRELKGFESVHLKPGEKRSVVFTLSADDLSFYNDQMKLVTEPGQFEAWIAPDSTSGLKVSFRVE
jgi:beta-glucosidase